MSSNKAQHTPGPWTIKRYYDDEHRYIHYIVVGPAMVRFLQCNEPATDPECKERAEANARLIAAAPELLAAATKVTAWDDAGTGQPDWPRLQQAITALRAAIAKATGEG